MRMTNSDFNCPYRGILSFRYIDKENFFGREKAIQELYAKILLYRVVVLFGESGAGKSSLLNAGLIPALDKEGFGTLFEATTENDPLVQPNKLHFRIVEELLGDHTLRPELLCALVVDLGVAGFGLGAIQVGLGLLHFLRAKAILHLVIRGTC